MIDRFNFYDIYGYLLPGGLMLTLLWLPFGLLLGKWPSVNWGSAALALGLAYIAGHLLHALSRAIFPSKFKDKKGKWRQPSYLLVDKEEDKVLPSRYRLGDLKDLLAKQIDEQFGIKIHDDTSQSEKLATRRSVAFYKCRSFLIKNKAAAYMEQQQGMYALMRGVGAALVFACALYAGIAVGSRCDILIFPKWSFIILFTLLGLTLFASYLTLCPLREATARKSSFWLLSIILLYSGAITAKATNIAAIPDASLPSKLELSLQDNNEPVNCLEKEHVSSDVRQAVKIQEHKAELIFAMAAAAAILSLLCISASRGFAASYTATIYRDFSLYAPPPTHQIQKQEYKHSGQ
jgi:hypothetical protein